MEFLLLALRLILAGVFGTAGIAKLLDLPGSRKAVTDFGVPARFAAAAGLALPLTELAIALLLVPTGTARWGALAAVVLLLAFITAISISLSRGRAPDCHCFGQLHSEPAGPGTLIRNGILTAMAAFVLVAGWSDAGASLAAPFRDLSDIETALLVGELVLLALVAGLVWVVVQLLTQNGRILARLDEPGGTPAVASTDAHSDATAVRGLPVGTPAPAFTLPDLDGNRVSLAGLKSDHGRVLLLFTDPKCGSCQQVLSHVNEWQAAAGDRVHIEIISRGDHMANIAKAKEYALSRVLIQSGFEISQLYETGGTPTAVLIEAAGTIGTSVAVGFEQIRDLAAALIDSETESVPQPASMALPDPATPLTGPAPSFRLPSVAGNDVSLDDLLAMGRPVMLHFTAPQCAPCYDILPDIGGWQRHYHDRLTSVIISADSREQNRMMMSEYGIDLNLVLLQAEHEVFDAFDLRQMPTAIVIDPIGDIQAGPANGALAVRRLMADTLGLKLPPRPMAAVELIADGEKAPEFRRPDLDGTPYDIGAARGSDTMVLFWNPGCSYCQQLLPDMRKWEAHLNSPDIVVVSRGTQEINRQLGFNSPIVIDDDRVIARSYGATGTPAVVEIDANGFVVSGVGRGATKVREVIEGRIASIAVNQQQQPG